MANFHVYVGHDASLVMPTIRKIGVADIRYALARGIEDFRAMPSYLAFLALIYPFCGLVLAALTSYQNALHLLFPVASGFALVGPFAAIGLYEMSRRRELGLSTEWRYAFNVLRSPSIPSILALGLALTAIFFAWLAAAQGLYVWLFGPAPPASFAGLVNEVLTTRHGWALLGLGCFVGLGFAIVALCISVVSFPLLLDRDAGLAVAIGASLKAVRTSPAAFALWGLIVAAALVVGSAPFFVGLVFVMPILGHATWHLYRRAMVRDPAHEHPAQPPAFDWAKWAKARVSPHSFLFPK